MLGLLFSLGLGQAPPPTSSVPAPTIEPAATSVEATNPAPPPPNERRLSKGQRLVLGAGVAYGLGSAIQWATVGGTGMLDGARPGASSAVTLGMTLGGLGMVEGLVIGGIGGRELARESRGQDHRAKPLIAGGAVLAGLGGGALIGTTLTWPTIRARCPIGVGCGLAGMHLGGAALGVGVGMMSAGHHLAQRAPDHRRLSKRAQTPLIAGSVMLSVSYFASSALGMAIWQDDPSDPVARRTRDRLLIPIVGPWIHAAGPDAPMLMAVVTGGLGAVQIAGGVALAVGAGLTGAERRRGRERVQVTVVPSFDGVSIVGRF